MSQAGFRSLVRITSLYPLWEQKGLKAEEQAGLGYLPDAPTGEREALITGPLTSEPEQILRLPGPGWTAFIAAVATAIVFAAMTLKLTVVGVIAGAVATAAYVHWLWSMDRAYPRELADAGRGLALPLYMNGTGSVGRWAMGVLLISDAAVVASFIFAYLFLWTSHPAVWPPDGSRPPTFLEPGVASLLLVAAALAFEWADRLNQRERRLATGLCFVAAAALSSIATGVTWRWLTALGIEPTAHSYGAVVWTLLGYMAAHVAIAALMALWCLVRLRLGMIDAWRCQTLRVCLLWWRFTTIATVLSLVVVTVFPHVAS
jgi:cytochrome c oxidase subunit I+III